MGAGRNAGVLHYERNSARAGAGDLVLVDAGCEHACYTADITRTFPAGGRFSAPQREVYQLVADMQELGLSHIAEGAAWADIDGVSADEERGLLGAAGRSPACGGSWGRGSGLVVMASLPACLARQHAARRLMRWLPAAPAPMQACRHRMLSGLQELGLVSQSASLEALREANIDRVFMPHGLGHHLGEAREQGWGGGGAHWLGSLSNTA